MNLSKIILACLLCAGFGGCHTPNTATQPSTRLDYPADWQERWMQRHAGFVREAGRGGVEVLFLGDSITDYWRSHGRAVWDREFAPLGAANFGISGDRTQNVLWRITHGELEGIKPKVVVLMIGTNNTGPGFGGEQSLTPQNTSAEIVAGIHAIVKTLAKSLPEARILVLGIFPRGDKEDPLRKQLAEINQSLGKYVGGRNVRFLDITSRFLAPDGTLSKEIMPDLLHPNERGYEIWADAIRDPLRAMLDLSP